MRKSKKKTVSLKDVFKHFNMIKNIVSVPDGATPKGIITVNRYRSGMVDAVQEHIKRTGCTEICETVKSIQSKYFIATATEVRNLVVTSDERGRNLMIHHLKGDQNYTLEITHGEIGDDNTTPDAADTELGNALDRKAKSTSSITAANQITLQFFWADAELSDDTYYEFGTYCDSASLSLGDGRLFNHALFDPSYVKASGEDTTVQVTITLNQ